ncbi:MAG: amino acid ABC transporter ATP-binding protein [Treponema sp.]|nr:amino acid ABC transporter ATP-binding protein [Treponema sp.]
MLEVEKIAKRFGTAEVLNDITFSLNEGEVLAVIGSSGSGKTTLLRCLNFLEKPDCGRIVVRGETLFDSDDHKKTDKSTLRQKRLHFGLVFQSFNLFPQYTAFKNVVLARELAAKKLPDYKKNKKSIIEEIHNDGMQLLDKIGLTSKKDFYPHQLSGGQQQRVAIARALALKPDILCFDEPTSALDPELTGEVLKVIRNLAEPATEPQRGEGSPLAQNTTMIIVTHEMHFARQVADTILFIDEGLIVEYGKPELLDNPSSDRLKRFLERYSQG